MSTQTRVHAGTPTGGQFATSGRSEPNVDLRSEREEPSFAGLDDRDREVFTQGECGVLAWDLSARTGWPVVIACDGFTEFDGGGRSYGWTHAGVQRPDGLIVDVEGVHKWEDWLDTWYDDPEEEYDDFTLEVVTDPREMSMFLDETSPEVSSHSARVADAVADAARPVPHI